MIYEAGAYNEIFLHLCWEDNQSIVLCGIPDDNLGDR